MPRTHAILSPSSSERWINCPPSAKENACGNTGSTYAQQGTDAHALCEYKVKQALGHKVRDPTPDLEYYDEEMEECATAYCEFIMEQLQAAKEICEGMCREYLSRGLCFGGTGDTGNSPESESCAELLESCLTLAERTGEAKWLEWAKQAAHVLSTWVVSYRFPFPKDSAHGRIGVNSVGSVVASVQNRHAAPGFCIDSGESLRRLAKLTGDAAYQELYDDVRSFFPQAISTPEHPVLGRMVVQDPLTVEFGGLHERVNLSGWEGNDQVGETYWRGAWTMAAFLLMTPDDVDERLAALKAGGVEGGTIGAVTNFGDYATVDYELNPTDESRIRCRLTLPRPEHWTGRMWGQGNGGPAGEVGTCEAYALAGDAAVHTDMGTHFGVAGKSEVLVDFGHRATHLMTVTGKSLIERY